MPVIWKYLIVNFLRVFGLTVGAFLAILLASRLEEIAHFASFGAEFLLILLFTLFQIPYILPIAIPIACLISAILLMQRLSTDQELTAIRAAGFSLKEITTPLLLTAFAISLLNFYCVSEIATLSHYKSNLLKNELKSVNPLLLLHNKHLLRTKGMFFETLGPSKLGQSASDVILALPNQNDRNLRMVIAKKLQVTPEVISADQLTLIAPLSQALETGYAPLLMENISVGELKLKDFSSLIDKKIAKLTLDSLSMGYLLIKWREWKALYANDPTPENKKAIRSLRSEIARRFSLGFAPLSLTLLGIAFGIGVSRIRSRGALVLPIFLTALFLSCFFAAKAMENRPGLAMPLYLAPQVLIIIASVRKLDRISHGRES
jgi:lipopolysaccharide export system permease protein